MRAFILLMTLNLVLLAGIIIFLAAEYGKKDGKYILYIGTNDKDTYTQEIPMEEAKNIVNEICVKYVDGYTVSDAKGAWVDETDTLTQENTLVYIFYDVTEEQLEKIMDEVLRELNQNSILIEYQKTEYSYYSGRQG